MDAIAIPVVLSAEDKLLRAISRSDVSLDEVIALGIDLGSQLQALDVHGRTLALTRLRSKAEESRAAGAVTDAVLIELVMRSLQRFLR